MKKQNGFTIVEVALVLAIAGLIFLMAFIALPSLWASQRDADRKAKVMEFVNDIKTYQTNNSRGALPVLNGPGPEEFSWAEAQAHSDTSDTTSWKAFIRDYVDRSFADPAGGDYNFYVVKCLAANGKDSPSVGSPCVYPDTIFGVINDPGNVTPEINKDLPTIYVAIGATCDGDSAVKANGSRSVAAFQVLERGGRHCYGT